MARYHFDQHRREALVTSRRFTVLSAFMVTALMVAGAYFYFMATHASNGQYSVKSCTVGNQNCVDQSAEAKVSRFYLGLLARSADKGGYDYWTAGLIGSFVEHDVTGGLINSTEFKNKYPNASNDTFVRLLYQNGMGRAADTDGYNYWMGQLNSNVPRADVAASFLGFAEAITHLRAQTNQTMNAYSGLVYQAPGVNMTLNGTAGNIFLTQGAALTVAWSTTNSPTSCTAGGAWTGAKAGSGSENHTADTATVGTRTYSLTCSNGVGSTTLSRAVGVNAPAPPPKSPTTPAPAPTPPKTGGTSTGAKGGSATPAATPASSDTQPPSKPDRFSVNLGGDGSVVLLSWNASTDDKGIKGYLVERSLDQQAWDTLVAPEALSDTSYADKGTQFGVHYYYRVTAVDTAGNKSEAVLGDTTTSAFTSNASSGSSTTLSSDDGFVSATIPGDALAADASCSLVSDTTNKALLSKTGKIVAAGPYTLSCKTSSGEEITDFKSGVTFAVATGAVQFQKLTGLTFYSFNDTKWVPIKGTTDKKTKVLTITASHPLEVVVLGSIKHGFPWNWFFIIVFVLLAIVGIFVLRARQMQKQQYDEYIRRKYYNF